MNLSTLNRRRFLASWITLAGTLLFPCLDRAQDATPGMMRRQDRRDDRGDRMQQRDDKFVQRRDDPIGIRGPQRREDRRTLRTDRQSDRRERIN